MGVWTKMVRLLTVIGFMAAFLIGGASQPMQVITVCPQGPPACQFSKIQEALNTAPDGATIVISPGLYREGHVMILRNINLLGVGPQSVLLQAHLTISKGVRASVQALTLVSITVETAAQVTLSNMRVTGDIDVAALVGETEPRARVIMTSVQVLGGGTSRFSYALYVGHAEALVTGSEFFDRLIAIDDAKVWLYDTWLNVPADHAGIEAYGRSDLVFQGVKIFSGGHGVLASDSARLHIEESYVVSFNGLGLVLAIEACGASLSNYLLSKTYEGLITGRENEIPDKDELGGNPLGDVCPSELEFLKTPEGGQYP